MTWLKLLLQTAFRGTDLYVGLGSAALTLGLCASPSVRGQGVTILIAEGALDVAVLSVVLAAMAMLAGYVDGPYRKVLEAVGGVRRAFLPFSMVAGIAALSATVSLLAAIGWPAFGGWARAASFAVTTGLTAWMLAGAVSLIGILIFHAEQRAKLAAGVDRAQEIRARRLSEPQEEPTDTGARSSDSGSHRPENE